MKLSLYINQIDYYRLSTLFLPRIGKSYGELLPMIIGMLAKATRLLPTSLKDKAAVNLCSKNKGNIISTLNGILDTHDIQAKADNAVFFQEDDNVVIQVEIAEINYEQVAVKFLPQILKAIPETEGTKPILSALDMIENERESIVRGALSALDDEKKEQLVKHFLTAYHEKITDVLNKLITDNQIAIHLNDIVIS